MEAGEPRRILSKFVEVLRTGLHGVDDQLVTVVVDQHDEFEKTPGRIHANQQPAPRVVLVIKWTGAQGMDGCMAHCIVIEAVTTVVLPRSLCRSRNVHPGLDSSPDRFRPVLDAFRLGPGSQSCKGGCIEPHGDDHPGAIAHRRTTSACLGKTREIVPGLRLVGPSLDLLVRDGFTPQQMFTHINSVYEIIDAFSNKQPPRAARVLYTIIIAISSLIQAMPIKLAQRRSSTGCPSKKQP